MVGMNPFSQASLLQRMLFFVIFLAIPAIGVSHLMELTRRSHDRAAQSAMPGERAWLSFHVGAGILVSLVAVAAIVVYLLT
jgi:uncharacterized membrane protein YhaH (DUF805 family)